MTPQEYGARTGQHQQGTQQAALFQCVVFPTEVRPTRIEAYLGCDHPPCEDWLRDVIEMAFVHADRIQIDTWSFPEEEEPPQYDATYYREMAADAASDADRD